MVRITVKVRVKGMVRNKVTEHGENYSYGYG